MKRIVCLTFIFLILTLSACNGLGVLSSPPPGTPTAATTIVATRTPIMTPIPVPTSTPFPPPDFLDSLVAQSGFLLSSSDDPDCQLPCWQGLRIGESDSAAVQRMFEDIFGFSTGWDVFEHPEIVESVDFPSQFDLPGTRVGGYGWYVSRGSQSSASFEIFAVVDQQTDILQGIWFNYNTGIGVDRNAEGQSIVVPGTELYELHTVGQTIRVLGSPDAIYFDSNGDGFEMILIYEEGIVSSSFTFEPPKDEVANSIAGTYQEFCLDDPLWFKREFIVAPFDLEKLDELTSIQQRWIVDSIRIYDLTPLEDLGWVITKEEIVDAAMTQDSPCLLFGPIE